MLKQLLIISLFIATLFSCDTKKSSVSGKVISKTSGAPVHNAIVSFIQCKENGDNCTEHVIGQAYTNENGEFIIEKKTASKSKTKWITVYKNYQKLAQVDNIGLNDKNLVIEAQ